MSSPAQIAANQLNAKHSSGPKTEAGKAAASTNATKHGLTAAFTVLANEDQDEFDQLLEQFREQFQPANIHQDILVNQMVKAQWQLARAERLEAVAFDLLAVPCDSDDLDTRIVNSVLAAGRDPLSLFQRYRAQAERSYYKAYREFAASRKIQNEANLVAKLDASLTRRVVFAPPPGRETPICQPPVQNKPNPQPAAAKPSLRSQMPENLALCL